MTTAPIIFVVGSSRSGTTMMGRILGKSSQIFTFHELHFFEQLWSPSPQPQPLSLEESRKLAATLLSIQRDGYLAPRQPEKYFSEIQDLFQTALTPPDVFRQTLHYEASLYNKEAVCDQTPRNIFYMGEILSLYPDARFIVLVRDPRDVLLSQKNKWRRRFLGAKNIPLRESFRAWLNYHPLTISMLWCGAVRAGLKFADNPRVRQVRFEDLLLEPEKTLQSLCVFLGLEYTKDMLDVPQVGSSKGEDSPSKLGINSRAASRWQGGGLSQTEIALCEQVTAVDMKRLGYERTYQKVSELALLGYRLSWPFKTGLALVMNLGRTRNLLQTLQRRLGKV